MKSEIIPDVIVYFVVYTDIVSVCVQFGWQWRPGWWGCPDTGTDIVTQMSPVERAKVSQYNTDTVHCDYIEHIYYDDIKIIYPGVHVLCISITKLYI